MGYTITFHRASQDTSSGAYDEITDTTVDAFTGHSEIDCQVRIPGGVPHTPEDEQITFLGGEKSPIKNYRRVWEMTFLPAAHQTNTTHDVADLHTFLAFVLHSDYPYLWMDMSAYSTASGRAQTWHTAGKYLPITVDDWSTSINEKQGTETLTVTISHRFRNK